MYNQSNEDNTGYGGDSDRITIGGDCKKHTDGDVADDGRDEDVSDATRIDQRLNTMLLKDGTTVLLPSSHDVLSLLDTFTRKMLKDDIPAFKVHYKGHRKRMRKASKLADYFGVLRNAESAYSSALTYPPHIELFFELYRVHPISYCACVNPWQHFDTERLEGEVAEEFRLAYRTEADWQGTRKKLDDWDRRSETNLARLKQYVNALFDAYARIVTVRVDFYHHQAIIDPDEVNLVLEQAEEASAKEAAAYRAGNDEEMVGNTLARVGIKEVMRDRDRLFANMRGKPSLFEHLVGHVWRIEYSRVGGYLLRIVEGDAAPTVKLKHSTLELGLRPGADVNKRREVLEAWYREQLRAAVSPLLEKWEPLLGVKARRILVQHMKTKWGSCNPVTGNIRLNTDLACKPSDCLEYILVHELLHLIEPTHNARFQAFMDRFMPQWRQVRDALNRLPVRHEEWGY